MLSKVSWWDLCQRIVSPDVEVEEVFLPQARLPVADDFADTEATNRIFSPAAPPDGRARAATTGAALNLLQEALQSAPKEIRDVSKLRLGDSVLLDPLPSATSLPKVLASDDGVTAHTNTPPPPFRGAAP